MLNGLGRLISFHLEISQSMLEGLLQIDDRDGPRMAKRIPAAFTYLDKDQQNRESVCCMS